MIDQHPAFCLWGEKCGLFKACAHSIDVDQTRFCPTYRGPYCGHFIPRDDETKKEKT
jgi:hypothetical protein